MYLLNVTKHLCNCSTGLSSAEEAVANCTATGLAAAQAAGCVHDDPGGFNFAALVVMLLIVLTAVPTNLSLISIVLATAELRENITYVFVLSLAFVDLLASLTVVPMSAAAHVQAEWTLGRATCQLEGFLSSFFMAASIFSICAISIERFYSIKWPMHYAVHMTMAKAGCVVVVLGLAAFGMALAPLVGWSRYDFNPVMESCTFEHKPSYTITLGVTCFLLPGSIVLCMYYGIYRVAKHTACQIQPSRSVAAAALDGSQHSDGTDRDSGVSSTSESRPDTAAMDIDLFDAEDEDDNEANGHRLSHWKAIRTLFVIITLFLALWGPYFALLFHTAAGRDVLTTRVYRVTTWLAFSSYAVNPLVYGLLNRAIRDAMHSAWHRLRDRRVRVELDPAPEPSDGGNEDFFQFLERTSSIPNDALQTLDVKNLPSAVELGSQNGRNQGENGRE